MSPIRETNKEPREDQALLERQIESINRFPDQNPNPVLRTTWDGRLIYANPASAPIITTLGVTVGDMLPKPLFGEMVMAAEEYPPRAVEIRCGVQTFAVLTAPVRDLGVYNLYGTDVTAAKVVEEFPDRNPNPVLRMTADGTLIYANPASEAVTASLGVRVGDSLPAEVRERIRRRIEDEDPAAIEVSGGGRTFSLTPVVIPAFGFTHIYGTDVTALHAVDKFPNENPNPVLRVSRDRILTYANPASALIREAWHIDVGDRLPDDLYERLAAAADRTAPDRLEVECSGRIFSLLVVAVFEFDSINLYGTDITAARQVEIANRENERLLLNILPPSIADRLRGGEQVIADRFEEMTILFADVVNFTPFASTLAPTEVVMVLNAVFSIFDGLADRYRLEKIKTIGDAYMVIGGLSADDGHVERVAEMALDMIEALDGYRTPGGERLDIRVGMHVGPTIGGIIGLRKFIYDVWGDTVNTASRMESTGVPGRFQVSEETYERLKGLYEFEPRGMVDVKGKGPMSTYFLVGRLAPPTAEVEAAGVSRRD